MNIDINEKVNEIKRSFRLQMNGVASHSMRQKGADYKINWGLSLVDLQDMAKQYGKDYHLAIALWKEDIRECKVLASLIMPTEKMLPEIVEVWVEQIKSQDMAEVACFNLFQHLDYAPVLAYQWMASDKDIYQICAYQLLSRLFMKGHEPNERGINEFIDQAAVALQSKHVGVRHAAMNSIVRFMELGENYREIANKAMKIDF